MGRRRWAGESGRKDKSMQNEGVEVKKGGKTVKGWRKRKKEEK